MTPASGDPVKPEIEILGISIKTFGVMFALGFLACGAVVARQAARARTAGRLGV